MKKKILASLLAAAMAVSMLAGCGTESTGTKDNQSASAEQNGDTEGDKADSAGAVTIKLFSNLPDRKNGQGLVEQMIIESTWRKTKM